MKTIRYIFWGLVALCLVIVGLANREMVTLRAMPQVFADFLGISPDITMPLFMAIFIGVALGLLIGFVWEWIREYRIRAEARSRAKEVDQLRRENARLRSETASPERGDDVLALLDAPATR